MCANLPLDQILQGDCVEILERLPEKSVDLIFADPPYNLQLQKELWRPNQTRVDAVDDDWDHYDSLEAYDAFCRQWIAACRRVLKDTGTLWVIGSYHNIFRIGALLQDLGFWFLNDVIWIKTNPMPNFRGVRFTNAHETLLWVSKFKGARYTFNHHALKALNDDLQMRSDWLLPICNGPERIRHNGQKAHSTQKPEALLYRVLTAASRPGDVVLDPFFGSGTTGAVAKKLGRHWIGIEREAEYIRVAEERLSQVQPLSDESAVYALEGRAPAKTRRLPFGRLLEAGLLQPGQSLYYRGERAQAAQVRADGRLMLDGLCASIHGLASQLSGGAPANGWLTWYYEDENQRLCVIDELRQRLLADSHGAA